MSKHPTKLFLAGVIAMALIFAVQGQPRAQTPDGETPAVEAVCDNLQGKAFGLCNAFCEALDCDDPASADFGGAACDRLLDRYFSLTGDTLPICIDEDEDGVSNSEDNCPVMSNSGQEDVDSDGIGDVCDNCLVIANSDQADTDGNGIGDACEVTSTCPCDFSATGLAEVGINGIGPETCLIDGEAGVLILSSGSIPEASPGAVGELGEGFNLCARFQDILDPFEVHSIDDEELAVCLFDLRQADACQIP